MNDLAVAVLGPLVVTRAGAPVDLGGPQRRAVLAVLALAQGRTVSVEGLMDALWPSSPPADAKGVLQSQVSRLRSALDPGGTGARDPEGVLRSEGGGYRLAIEPSALDAYRFEQAVATGHRVLASGDVDGALAAFAEAESCWRGPVLADLPERGFAAGTIARLDDLRLGVAETALRARLDRGEGKSLLADIALVVDRYPLVEPVRVVQITALYRAGRQAEALAVGKEVRERLLDELGVDPSPELQAVELAVLNHDASLSAPVPTRPPALERYRLERRLGVGDGDLWLGRDTALGRDVVVAFGPAVPPDERARIKEAATELGRLTRHPAFVAVLDIGEERDRVFIVSEHLGGGSLSDRLVADAPPDAATLAPVAAALAHLHAEGAAHGDLRPSRVLFGADGRPRLGGVGLAVVQGRLERGGVDADLHALAGLLESASDAERVAPIAAQLRVGQIAAAEVADALVRTSD